MLRPVIFLYYLTYGADDLVFDRLLFGGVRKSLDVFTKMDGIGRVENTEADFGYTFVFFCPARMTE